jgi:signal transduction histidine kinase
MRRLRPTDLALPLIAAAVSLAIALVVRGGVLDWLFATILLTALLFAVRQAWGARRAARRARRLTDELQNTSAENAARAAVVAERARLSADIESYVRELVAATGQRASAALLAPDPTADIKWIQSRAQQANSELRRQLGLLRADEPTVPASPDPAAERSRLRTADVIVAILVVALAAAEMVTLLPMERGSVSWLSQLLTLTTAATVLGRRTHPVLAALAASTLMTVGAITAEPVQDGLWIATTAALLAWTLAARGTPQTWAALGTLAVTYLASRQLNQPQNVPIGAAILTVAAVAGTVVGRNRRRLADSASAAADRTEELRAAAAEAVAAERRLVARELHDLVSHAVSLVAVQAGAAEMLWPTDPGAARESLRIVAATTEQTVAELDRLRPGSEPVARTLADLPPLIDRMRAAGLAVTLAVDAEPDPASAPAVYRVVQEALTNALRHAPESPVDVRVTSGPATRDDVAGATIVRVVSGGAVPSPTGRRGFGLIGLRERVEQVGGTLQVGPQLDPPGYAVTAMLPAARTSGVT